MSKKPNVQKSIAYIKAISGVKIKETKLTARTPEVITFKATLSQLNRFVANAAAKASKDFRIKNSCGTLKLDKSRRIIVESAERTISLVQA
jgi:hypothetical protein